MFPVPHSAEADEGPRGVRGAERGGTRAPAGGRALRSWLRDCSDAKALPPAASTSRPHPRPCRQVLKANRRAKKQGRESGRRRYRSSQVLLVGRCLSLVISTMDSAREPTQGRLDAVGFWQVWQRFDPDGK